MLPYSRFSFIQGLALGVTFTLIALLVIMYIDQPDRSTAIELPAFDDVGMWIYANLGLSLPVFIVLLLLYIHSLRKLKRYLLNEAPIEQVAQQDHLVDTWISLFFGVGVIWTAIGMRGALVFALGEPEVTHNLGAYDILDRMVQGGILIALSTTIVGGIGGYLMRVIKTLTVESDIKYYYDRVAHEPAETMQATLSAIEAHLHRLSQLSKRGYSE